MVLNDCHNLWCFCSYTGTSCDILYVSFLWLGENQMLYLIPSKNSVQIPKVYSVRLKSALKIYSVHPVAIFLNTALCNWLLIFRTIYSPNHGNRFSLTLYIFWSFSTAIKTVSHNTEAVLQIGLGLNSATAGLSQSIQVRLYLLQFVIQTV